MTTKLFEMSAEERQSFNNIVNSMVKSLSNKELVDYLIGVSKSEETDNLRYQRMNPESEWKRVEYEKNKILIDSYSEEIQRRMNVGQQGVEVSNEEKEELTLTSEDAWNSHTVYKASGALEGYVEVQFNEENRQFNGVILFTKDSFDEDEMVWEALTDSVLFETIKEKAIQDYKGEKN